jgi:hypothetical protein
MAGLTRLISIWRAVLALVLLIGLLCLAIDPHSQSPAGVLGLFAFSLFISLGFVLFGQQRFEPSATRTRLEARNLA